MTTKWTEEQQQVISLRNRNLLVSAAAGSGKTAVLVERIISMITDLAHPVDIDRLLVVTFTKAAAAEMRERIAQAIEQKLEEEPENVHLQRQSALVHNAKITTIDSFCQYVIANYFYKIDLEPGFRVGDEGEMKLLRSDVLGRILEEHYAEALPDFCDFVERYATDKKDDTLQEEILRLYDFAMSYPFPEDWLRDCVKAYDISSETDMNRTPWMQTLLYYWQNEAAGMEELCLEAIRISKEPGGPYMYTAALESDLAALKELAGCTTYEAFAEKLGQMEFVRLASKKKSDELDTKLVEAAKNLRDQVKKLVKKLNQDYFTVTKSEIIDHIENAKQSAQMFVSLTLEFMERFAQEKKERNLLDFDDLEHFALNILVDGQTRQPTQVADEFARFYEEIMIDEYQDSNYVQELILTSISRQRQGQNNVFMVGDVKQSIYGFRLARPDLFMEKYSTYTEGESDAQKIELHKNFRSFDCVLSSVNDLCRPLMQADLGGIAYDENAALYPGGNFSNLDMQSNGTEILLTDDDMEAEARMIVRRIRQLTDSKTGMDIYDKEENRFRKARFGDIVILMRSLGQKADLLLEVLKEADIPAYSQSKTGYFKAVEVQTVLAVLQVVDNPRQDIPLAAVLKSPMVGMSAAQMAQVKALFPDGCFYDSITAFAQEGPEDDTKAVICRFLERLADYRKRSTYTQIHELIMYILEDTGYDKMAAAMPGGSQRSANLDMLIERAIAYEKTSYRGLFQFVRYVEQLKKYEVDFGEAETIGENENAVGVFSIHKSKGLEFPIVFVSGLGRKFNTQDLRKKVALHPKLGIGLDDISLKERTKCPTLLKRAVNIQNRTELLGEELRILYVAVTRAREKLILTGGMANAPKRLQMLWQMQNEKCRCSFRERFGASSMMDWVLLAFAMYKDAYMPVYESAEELSKEQAQELLLAACTKQQLQETAAQITKEQIQKMNQKLAFEYPYKNEAGIPAKMSVSEIKMASMKELDKDAWQMFEQPETELYVPKFMGGVAEDANSGAFRGTAYHRVLECLDFTKELTKEEILRQMKEMLYREKITDEMAELVSVTALWEFSGTNLFDRMQKAARAGCLHKEQPFVMGIPAEEIDVTYQSREPVLVQGIIDAYFEEEGQIILMDYKTDRVDSAEKLAEHYKKQLELYAFALEKTSGKKVSEIFIYSFHLKEEISIAI